ncbi:MAG: NUDIX hydrolase [Lachnospiraceae bacterium]|nr:NUDIX hydrolase [Lachnospiraceae bacterium]
MGEIKKINKLTDKKFLNFYELETVRKTGRPGRYFMASRAENPEELEINRGETRADGVTMYVLCGPKRDKVLLIHQFRWAIGHWVYEFPAGLVEKGESYRDAAVREVWEETGMKMTPLDVDSMYERPYYMTDGLTDECCAMVYGICEDDALKPQHLEESEEIEVVLADRDEVRRILREERLSENAAFQLMHFLHDVEDPFAFLDVK